MTMGNDAEILETFGRITEELPELQDYFEREKKLYAGNTTGEGIWWVRYRDPETGRLFMRTKNVPNAMSCICGDHPLSYQPVMDYEVHGGSICSDGTPRYATCLVSGIPRSGSTPIWQIVNGLSDNMTVKSHSFHGVCPLLFKFKKVFVSVRHPYDVAYSLMRNDEIKEKDFDPSSVFYPGWNSLNDFVRLERLQTIAGLRGDLDLYFLKYEDYWSKDLERARELATLMEINPTDEDLAYITKETSVEKNFERSSIEGITRPIVENWGIRPRHVGPKKGIPGQGANLSTKLKQDIFENLSWVFRLFEYTPDL